MMKWKWNWKRFGIVAAISFLAVQLLFIALCIVNILVYLVDEYGWEAMAGELVDTSFYTDLFEVAAELFMHLTLPVALYALIFAAALTRWRWEGRIWIGLTWPVGLALGISAPYVVMQSQPRDMGILIGCTLISSASSAWIVYRYLRHVRRASQ